MSRVRNQLKLFLKRGILVLPIQIGENAPENLADCHIQFSVLRSAIRKSEYAHLIGSAERYKALKTY